MSLDEQPYHSVWLACWAQLAPTLPRESEFKRRSFAAVQNAARSTEEIVVSAGIRAGEKPLMASWQAESKSASTCHDPFQPCLGWTGRNASRCFDKRAFEKRRLQHW